MEGDKPIEEKANRAIAIGEKHLQILINSAAAESSKTIGTGLIKECKKFNERFPNLQHPNVYAIKKKDKEN